MGLDMYLYVETYQEPSKDAKWFNHSYLLECVAYWRKSNEIHNWFVVNHQNNRDECAWSSSFHSDELRPLVDLCKQVLSNREIASELLPTKSGFFFGSTEYDEAYFESLSHTVAQLEPILAKYPDHYFVYRSSW